MQNEWLYIGLFLVIGIIVPIVPLVFARLVAPRKAKSNQTKYIRVWY